MVAACPLRFRLIRIIRGFCKTIDHRQHFVHVLNFWHGSHDESQMVTMYPSKPQDANRVLTLGSTIASFW